MRTSSFLLLAALAVAVPAAAQPTIQAGQTVSGRLETSDPTLADDSHFDDYTYRGRAGERLTITLRSGDFDAFLQWGTGGGASFALVDSDDDGGGGTDAQLEVTVGADGIHTIRANSYSGGQTGAYTISVERAGAAPRPRPGPNPGPAPGGRTLRAGQTVNGSLGPSDPRLGDDSYYHQYLYEGRAGEQLLVTMTSGEFDAYLRWGRMDGGRYEHLGFDDDGAGGTNARLEVTLDRDGTYAFQANSYSAGMTGAYTISVRSAQGGDAGGGAPSIALGQTVRGRLESSDPLLPDDSHYDQYHYRGPAGQRILITLRSSDFDAYLLGGRMVGGEFEAEASDDDSGGGTDAQLVATVGPGGVYAFRANSFSGGATGAYTVTVEPVSGATTQRRPTPAGARTISAGQTQQGTLRRGDPMLSDSSYYHEYVYQGTPGDRLEITLASSDFDTYLRWGRVEGGAFTQEAFDDDGAGGTNSRLQVTVGGTGLYAIHANAFVPGATGAYTLTIRATGAATPAAAEAERTPSSLSGKWMYAYAEPRLPRHRPFGQRMQQAGALEAVVNELNAQFPMPRNIAVRMDQCGMINAFYSPRDGAITFCYEMVEHLANIFASGSADWTQEQREAVEGAYTFIMMHEVGHALIHQLDLPVTGREEDAVDQLAAVTLIAGGDKGAQAALAGALSLQPGRGATFDESDYAGEHSLGPQRLYNIMCWIYGSDPRKYSGIVTNGGLPEERAVRCPGEYDRMSKAWQRILQPHRMP